MASVRPDAAGEFVKAKLNVDIPWNDLIASGNLQKLLHAIVERLDRHENAIADNLIDGSSSGGGERGGSPGTGLVIVSEREVCWSPQSPQAARINDI